MITRRNFITGLIGLAAAVGLPMTQKAEAIGDGYPDHLVATEPRSHSVKKVFLDGVDITNDCFECHRSQGWARCFVRGEDGSFIIDGQSLNDTGKYVPHIARETFKRGKIVVEWDKPKGWSCRSCNQPNAVEDLDANCPRN